MRNPNPETSIPPFRIGDNPCRGGSAFARPSIGRPAFGRTAFTLTELLIVIGLILLVVTMAVPAFNVITGGRSIDSAQNQASAMLARARTEAMGLQEPRGVVIFPDPNTGRIGMTQVFYPDPNSKVLEVTPNQDEILLPVGVGCQTIGNTSNPLFLTLGVIMFDGQGRMLFQSYQCTGPNLTTRLTPLPTAPTTITTSGPAGQSGFVLYDDPTYRNQSGLSSGSYNQANAEAWVRDNAVPFLVNRYNGTLLRGE